MSDEAADDIETQDDTEVQDDTLVQQVRAKSRNGRKEATLWMKAQHAEVGKVLEINGVRGDFIVVEVYPFTLTVEQVSRLPPTTHGAETVH